MIAKLFPRCCRAKKKSKYGRGGRKRWLSSATGKGAKLACAPEELVGNFAVDLVSSQGRLGFTPRGPSLPQFRNRTDTSRQAQRWWLPSGYA